MKIGVVGSRGWKNREQINHWFLDTVYGISSVDNETKKCIILSEVRNERISKD
jgi:hypothetical protein